MKRILLASAFSGALFLGACTAPELTNSAALASDLQGLLTLAESAHVVSTVEGAIVSEAITGIEALAASTSEDTTSGATVEQDAVAAAETAVKQLAADLPNNAKVQSDSTLALELLGVIPASSSASASSQAEAAIGTLVIDYLAGKQPATAKLGAAVSPKSELLADADRRISALR